MEAIVVSGAILYTTIKKGHTAVDFIITRFPIKIQTIIQSFNLVLGLIIWAFIAWSGAIYSWEMWLKGERSNTLEIPFFPFRFIWILSSVILCSILLINLCESVKKLMKK